MIEARGLRKAYGGRTVLDGVDLTVRPGELVALLGPNGAGKTTTVEILEGYRAPDAGTVQVLGQNVRDAGPALRARVGLMLQGGAGLEPRATPRDLVRLYAAFHRRRFRSDELLDVLGLGAVAGTRVRRLSGGERQRLALAIALTGDPEVLLLDEPTAGMDPEARRTARDLIEGLRREGRTILLTTHDLGDVEELATRVAILHGGRIVADQPPEELTTGGVSALRFRLHAAPTAAAVDRLAARVAGSGGEATLHPAGGPRHGTPAASLGSGSPARPDAGHPGATAFEISPGRPSADLVLEVAQWAAREGLLLTELRAGAASLEERYLELTGDADVASAA